MFTVYTGKLPLTCLTLKQALLYTAYAIKAGLTIKKIEIFSNDNGRKIL